MLARPCGDPLPEPHPGALAGEVRAARGLEDEEAPELDRLLEALGAGHGIPSHGLVAGLPVSARGVPDEDGRQPAVLEHQLAQAVSGLRAGPQAVLASQGLLGQPPVGGRVRHAHLDLA